jgi:hypothetical protein
VVPTAATADAGTSWCDKKNVSEEIRMAASVEQVGGLDCAVASHEAAPAVDLHLAAPVERVSLLLQTIERDIIPRLMLAHRADDAMALPLQHTAAPTERDVEVLVGYLVKGDAVGAGNFIRRSREHGASAETVLLGLLAPAARRLGRMWEEDQCDFTVVTMGLWRLQRAMHELSPSFLIDAEPPSHGRRILLAPVPGAHSSRLAPRARQPATSSAVRGLKPPGRDTNCWRRVRGSAASNRASGAERSRCRLTAASGRRASMLLSRLSRSALCAGASIGAPCMSSASTQRRSVVSWISS